MDFLLSKLRIPSLGRPYSLYKGNFFKTLIHRNKQMVK